MKVCILLVVFFFSVITAEAEHLIPSTLDPSLAQAREEAFIPWSTREQSGAFWNQKAKSNIPIYYEEKEGELSRDLYIPNPGTGYWVLGGLTEAQLFKTHREKLKIKDTLISASVHKGEDGKNVYWALWAPQDKAHLLTDRMKELGISQASIEYSIVNKFNLWVASMNPFAGFITRASIILNALLLLVVLVLGFKVVRLGKKLRHLKTSDSPSVEA